MSKPFLISPLTLLSHASDFYESRLASVTEDQWLMPSVCEGWTVKDVADHVLGGNRFAVGMLAGLDAASAFQGAFAGGFVDDPLFSFQLSAREQLEAFTVPDALAVIVHHPDGDIGALQFLGFRVGDLVLHGWDLARSVGGDDSLDDDLAQAVWDVYHPMLTGSHGGAGFGAGSTGLVSTDATLAVRLLDLTGRRL
jgi:uncharacterized protein (TIGR03086 family)